MALLRVGESNFFSMAGSAGSSVASFCDLALHAAQQFEHTGRAGAQEDRVVVDVEHPKAGLAPADGRLWPCAVDPGDQASADAGLQDRLDQAPMLWGARGGVGLHAMGDREVVGPDVDPVDTRHRQDLVESRHPLHGLDHDHADDRAVGALRTEAAYLERGPGRSPGPVALRWITARADRLAGLLLGLYHPLGDPGSPGLD